MIGLALALGSAAVTGCGTPSTSECASVGSPSPACPPAAEPERGHDVSLDAVAWMQSSAEYDAAARTAYAAATRTLDVALAEPTWTAVPEEQGETKSKTPAVILDVDETVLDNSPYAAWLMHSGRVFEPATWDAWCRAGEAEPIPGAVEFTRYAASKGVDVYFVTNRDAVSHEGTLANLRAHGFPVDEAGERLMLRGEKPEWVTDKGSRRARIAEDHRILLLVGDNLGDFVDGAKADAQTRRALWEAHEDAWGRAWIMLPNPDYGSWEHPIYGSTQRLDAMQQRAKKLESLRTWSGPGSG